MSLNFEVVLPFKKQGCGTQVYILFCLSIETMEAHISQDFYVEQTERASCRQSGVAREHTSMLAATGKEGCRDSLEDNHFFFQTQLCTSTADYYIHLFFALVKKHVVPTADIRKTRKL